MELTCMSTSLLRQSHSCTVITALSANILKSSDCLCIFILHIIFKTLTSANIILSYFMFCEINTKILAS